MAQVARKTREGTVVSDKMDKTVVVTVSSSTRHRLYKKLMRRLRRYMVHDETNDAKLGDRVRIVESRPYSRRKRWQLAEVLIRADRPEVAAAEIDLELLGEVKVEVEEPETAASAEPEEPAEAVEQPETAASAEPEEPTEAVEQPEPEAKEAVEEAEAVEEPETAASAELEEPAEAAEQPEAAASAEPEEPAEATEQPEAEAKDAPEAEGEEENETS